MALANQLTTTWSIMVGDHVIGSGHEVFEWKVKVDRKEKADHESVEGWNLTAMM